MLTSKTPEITRVVPRISKNPIDSPKKKYAKIMVEIGPIVPIIAAFPDPIRLMPWASVNVGITVEMIAIKNPSSKTVGLSLRLVDGYWAPTKVTWGIDNRTVAFRVIPGSEKSMRVEVRVGGADINPYLAVAAALAAGLYGIEKNLTLEDAPISGNGYAVENAKKLSPNLYEATRKMQQSELARELFGDDFIDHFSASRIWEWREYQKAVTSWELQRYFEII